MKRLIWIILIVMLVTSVASCSRVNRIANDADWIVFDGQPSRDN